MDLQSELERVQHQIARIRQESAAAEEAFQQRVQVHQQAQRERYEALLKAQGVEAFLREQPRDCNDP